MLRHCNSSSSPSPKEEVVFYFHNKGTSRWSEDWKSKLDVPESYAYSLYWRLYLEYFTIERPQLCLDQLLLKGATSCGPNWRPGNADNFKGREVPKGKHLITNHYSGNFWSATCEHINHLEPMAGKMWYTDGELWIGRGICHRWLSLSDPVGQSKSCRYKSIIYVAIIGVGHPPLLVATQRLARARYDT
eukprot:scaffold2938_cov117-Skeletonema_marinoi.AAC.1